MYKLFLRGRNRGAKLSGVHVKVHAGKYEVKDDTQENLELREAYLLTGGTPRKCTPDVQWKSNCAMLLDILDDEMLRAIPVGSFTEYVKVLHEDRDNGFETHFKVK